MSARLVRSPRRLNLERLENRYALAATYPTGFVDVPIAEGISEGTAMEFAPNGDLWVLEQDGRVKRFRPGDTSGDVVGNIANLGMNSSGERGLLGIAFHPQYATNKRVYLYYTANAPALHNRISHFTVNDTDAADYYFVGAIATTPDAGTTGSPTPTVVFDLDNLSATNHNGGAIHFGPDQKLYAAVGDNAVTANAQTLNNVLGKILRMNDDGSAPADNPFVNSTTGKQETIWALGLRNPYTFAFQPGSGRMFINDVGQNTWEEIDDGIAGSNYGWPNSEGNHGSPPTGPGTPRGAIYEYSHGSGTFQGFAITGGAFYNPGLAQFPADYVGDYFFADFVNDWINVLDVSSGNATRFATDASSPVDLRVTGDGSLYYLARGLGQVVRVNYPVDNEHPWHNAAIPFDVDGSGGVFADDALTVINRINAEGSGPLPAPGPGSSPPPFLDVTADNYLAPDDALTVINYINANPTESEGEGVAEQDAMMQLLAADLAEASRRRRR